MTNQNPLFFTVYESHSSQAPSNSEVSVFSTFTILESFRVICFFVFQPAPVCPDPRFGVLSQSQEHTYTHRADSRVLGGNEVRVRRTRCGNILAIDSLGVVHQGAAMGAVPCFGFHITPFGVTLNGAEEENCTPDVLLTGQMLYCLSYFGKWLRSRRVALRFQVYETCVTLVHLPAINWHPIEESNP